MNWDRELSWTDMPIEIGERENDVRNDGIAGHALSRGDFVVTHALELVQDEGFTTPRGQRGDGCEDPVEFRTMDNSFLGGGSLLRDRVEFRV